MDNELKRRPPGDVQVLDQDLSPDAQPLSVREQQLLDRAYELFEDFREKLEEERSGMLESRRVYQMEQANQSHTAPQSTTLLSCIDNVVADQIDNLPEAKMLAEREDTAQSAEEISDIVAYILYHANFDEQYAKVIEDSAITGTGILQVYWDDDMEDGEGMVNVMQIHPEDFFPDPAYEDIQDGRGLFVASRVTLGWIREHFPEQAPYVKADRATIPDEYTDYVYNETSHDQATFLLEFWYKRYDAKKRKYRVHKALLAGHALLYSTELAFGGPKKHEYDQGVYAHGQYPFVLFRYRRKFRCPFGTGMVHDYRNQQNAIDRYMRYIDDNARQSAKVKTYIRTGTGVNLEDVADYAKDYVEFQGGNIKDILQTVQAAPLNGQVYQIMNYLVDTMKQDCGQSQFNRGEGGLGVTAASAIQALQEAGGKTSRMHTESYKQSFKAVVEQIIWVMSEYLEPGRRFAIVGGWDMTGNMQDRFVEILAPDKEGDELKKPAYAVRVQVQKRNPLQLQVDNEFLSQCAQICYQAGAPLPPEAVIGLMEGYPTKSRVLKEVQKNSIIQQQIQQMQQQIQQLQSDLQARNAVIEHDNKVMGDPSLMQQIQQRNGRTVPDYEGLMNAESNAGET